MRVESKIPLFSWSRCNSRTFSVDPVDNIPAFEILINLNEFHPANILWANVYVNIECPDNLYSWHYQTKILIRITIILIVTQFVVTHETLLINSRYINESHWNSFEFHVILLRCSVESNITAEFTVRRRIICRF